MCEELALAISLDTIRTKMKNKASVVFKGIISLLSSIGKAKNRFTNTGRARVMMFSLMNNKKLLMNSLSHKVQNLLDHRGNDDEKGDNEDHQAGEDLRKVLHNAGETYVVDDDRYVVYEDEDDKYPDLRHSLFDEFDEEDVRDLQAGGSVIEMVKNSKEDGEDFRLEDEIDHVADLFITRFHKQMRLQKLESFKRYREMLERSV